MIQLHNRSLRKCYAWTVALAILITSFSTSVSAETATGSSTSISGFTRKKISEPTSDDLFGFCVREVKIMMERTF